MPPKTRASSNAAAQPPTTSRPEPQRPTRTSARQRRNSDASNASDATSNSQAQMPAKRRRAPTKTEIHPRAQPEVIEEEQAVTEEVAPHCEGIKPSPTTTKVDSPHAILLSQPTTKQVHFTGDLHDSTDTSAATSMTPYIRRMTIKRRRSNSPAANASVKRIKSSRTSLPPTLSPGDSTQIVHEHSFAPLRQVLQERILRLSSLRETGPAPSAPHQFDGASDAADEDMLVLDGHHYINVAQLPSAPQTPTRKGNGIKSAATPGAYDRSQWHTERSQFHDAIIALQKEADAATSQLRILDIELESLGFAAKGTKSLQILQSVRESFAQAREFLETELPGSLAEETTNGDLVETLVAKIQEFADRLRTADKELEGKIELVDQLAGQMDGILDQLASKELQMTDLQDNVNNLEETVASQQQGLHELQNELQNATDQTSVIQCQHDLQAARVDELQSEKTELESNISRLSASLLDYQAEAAKLTSKINNIEEEHRNTVTAMNREREETVRDLEGRLDNETMLHNEAETSAQFRQETIQDLEAQVANITHERDTLEQEVDAVKAELGIELAKRENAETDLEEREVVMAGLETRVQRLDDELEQHREDLEELHQLAQTERAQREAAEAEIDGKEKSIEDLNNRLREQGKQANELRQKLFEVQTKHEARIEEMQQLAAERDLQHASHLADEAADRLRVEQVLGDREAAIKRFEEQLEETEREMRDTLADRNDQLELRKEQIDEQNAELRSLREAQRIAEETYGNEIRLKQTCIDGLDEEVTALKKTVAAHEATRADLEEHVADAVKEHTLQIDERNATIALLENEVVELRVRQNDLGMDKTRLERRVQEEAEFLLVFQNEKIAEVEELKRTIRDKQQKIQAVEDRVRETDHRWQDLLAAREQEVNALAHGKEIQANTIDTLKRKFGDYVRRTSGFITRLQAQVDAAKMHVDEEGAGLQAEGVELMEEFQRGEAHAALSAKGKGKKRKFDSAIGMGSPEAALP